MTINDNINKFPISSACPPYPPTGRAGGWLLLSYILVGIAVELYSAFHPLLSRGGILSVNALYQVQEVVN